MEGLGPFYPLWYGAAEMVYGSSHPAANYKGGNPDSMRLMTTADMRSFHREFYTPANMGIIASLPADMAVQDFLARRSGLRVLPEFRRFRNASAGLRDQLLGIRLPG